MSLTINERCRDLVLEEQLSDDEARELLSSIGFVDWCLAYRCLRHIASTMPARLALADSLPHLFMALANSANPDRVLVNLERFVHNTTDQVKLLQYLAGNPRAVEILVTLFAGSQFLTEILLRHPEYFEQLIRYKDLAQLKGAAQLNREIEALLDPFLRDWNSDSSILPVLDTLRRFQRWEFLRIGACDLLDLFDLPTVTNQLSSLADSLVQACLVVAGRETNTAIDDFAVIGMGKLGGKELNYSSDIDLIFLAKDNASNYWRVSQQLIDALTRTTGEGFLYRVDMRLRPWGRNGSLVYSVDGHIDYLKNHANLWEKQALLKARVIAGDKAVGQEFLDQATPLLFTATREEAQTEVRTMKQRIESHLRRHGRLWGEVKLGEGSIRDIEFVTQYLQLVHGQQYAKLHSHNTLDALARLSANRLLSPQEYRVLADGYTFLRTVEHHLQLMHYRQTHTLPSEAEALNHLARRLRFQGAEAGTEFVARYQQHSAVIRAVYHQYLEVGDGMMNPSKPIKTNSESSHPYVLPHLIRMPPAYVTVFNDSDIEHHVELAERLNEDNLVEVEAIALDKDHWRVTIVGYDYLGELSLICGLLFIYGFNIIDGHVFSYRRPEAQEQAGQVRPSTRPKRFAHPSKDKEAQRKIVDVFTVGSVLDKIPEDHWQNYINDLATLLKQLHAGQRREVQGELAKRVALALREIPGSNTPLYPVDIEIDNEVSDRHTVLRIDALDTIGFLYELTNALALNGINIRRMTVNSVGNRVHDTLYVTDVMGQKITASHKQRELRAATVLIKQFTHLLPQSPNPESALLNFHQFIGHLFTRADWPDELTSLERPEVLQTLARLLGVSDFLWNDFLRMQYANLFPVVRDVDRLLIQKSKQMLREEMETSLKTAADQSERLVKLNEFKDREMFRIDMRQIQEYITEFGQFSAELSDLAEVVMETTYQLCYEELLTEFGLPRLEDGQPCPLSVCGLGKCGGRELGFASDIELMFIFAGNGRTTGPKIISTSEFYEKLVMGVNEAIKTKREGIFELDLRLRPYGRAGSLAVSLHSFQRYFGPGGDAWPYERQALIKLRPIAGDPEFGQQIVNLRDEFIYNGDPFDIAAMRAMRERQIRHLVTAGTINAKFSPGGLVDVEYLVQALQISYGFQNPNLRLTNTREAIAALAAAKILSPEQYQCLHEAHIFLRRLINALRMVRGNARDLTLPSPEDEEFAFLASRLNYGLDLAQLRDDLTRHTACIQELSLQLLE